MGFLVADPERTLLWVVYAALIAVGITMPVYSRLEQMRRQGGMALARVRRMSRRLRRLLFLGAMCTAFTFIPRLPSALAFPLFMLARQRSRPNYTKVTAIANILDPDRFRLIVERDREIGRFFVEASRMPPDEAERYLQASLPENYQPLVPILSIFLRNPSRITLENISSLSRIYESMQEIYNQLSMTRLGIVIIPLLVTGVEFFLLSSGLSADGEILVDMVVSLLLVVSTIISGEL